MLKKHVVCVLYRRCFGSGGACRDDRRHFRIRRGYDPGCIEGYIYGGGEGDAQVTKRAVHEVCADRCRVRVEDLVNGVDCGIRRFAINPWDLRVFEALGDLINGGDHRGGGGEGEGANYQFIIII